MEASLNDENYYMKDLTQFSDENIILTIKKIKR